MIEFLIIVLIILIYVIAVLSLIIDDYKDERFDFSLYIKVLKERTHDLQQENHELWKEIYKRK